MLGFYVISVVVVLTICVLRIFEAWWERDEP